MARSLTRRFAFDHRSAGPPGHAWEVRVEEVREHDPWIIEQILDIDLTTFSEASLTRFTAGSLMRHGRLFLLRADSLVVGTMFCVRSWADPEEVALLNQAVRAGWRGHGLGTFFLEQVLALLQGEGIRSVVLHIDCDNVRARHVYEDKLGFRPATDCEFEYGPGYPRMMMRLLFAEASQEAEAG